MFDFNVEIYKDQQLVKVNFGEYIKNKKVLICPNVKILQKPTLTYFKYVETLLNLQQLDEIIILCGRFEGVDQRAIDILDFERSLDAELSQYVRKKSYPVLGIGGCALAPLTFGLSIPIIALYSYIPVTKVEPISKFYKDLPPQHKIKYKTEFNKKITAKKASGIQNGMLVSAALFFVSLVAVKPIISTASKIADPLITTTS